MGEYPKIDVSNKRAIRCIYGFLNIQNGHEYAFKTSGGNSEATINVLNKIGEIFLNRKIVIIWDNAPWHKSAKIRQYLSETKHSFKMINFPPYAPELNPQEHVWKDGRANVTHNYFIEDIDKATDQFISHLSNKSYDYDFLGLVRF